MSAPHPVADAPHRTVRVQVGVSSSEKVTVALVASQHDQVGCDNVDEVYFNGVHLGQVGSYRGSIDRKVGRQRVLGKQRTLWFFDRADRNDPFTQVESRAEAIRKMAIYQDVTLR